MNKRVRTGLWGVCFVAAVGLAAPVSAVPLSQGGGAGVKAAVPALVTDVRAERRSAKKHRRVYRGPVAPRGYAQPYGPGSVDTVGSLGFDGYGYAYNRFSGERYFSCVTDEGYGRVRRCDAGGRR